MERFTYFRNRNGPLFAIPRHTSGSSRSSVYLQMASTSLKKCMRKDIAQLLAKLSIEEIKKQSASVLGKIAASEYLKSSHKVGIYLSTDGEIITDGIVDLLFHLNKEIYVPNFTKGSKDMKFVRLTLAEWKEGLPSTMWNIRQHDNPSELSITSFDLLLMPGVAFSTNADGTIKRLGHGMGYFDRFLHQHSAAYGRLPYLMGLALREQLVDSVPTEDHDVPLDGLLYEQHSSAPIEM